MLPLPLIIWQRYDTRTHLIAHQGRARGQAGLGGVLGTPANLTPAATQKGRNSNQAKAHTNEHNERAAARILLLHEQGLNYSQITERLNALRFLTRTGKAFHADQVKRL